ncbi:hypothetical protein [Sediminitomix flava]|uniref:Uncharacterized protein n=1 Tax=Sediminitomix flava TaxID=379075 RepID=A0A315ZXM4_SEDFL|nr:hypothetical protein [Sediminitomix flava]PWJ42097.1 hypothetical protein BC781_103347 [Sediminitomix flava]
MQTLFKKKFESLPMLLFFCACQKGLIFLFILNFINLVIPNHSFAQQAVIKNISDSTEINDYQYIFPLLGENVNEKGFTLPYPHGIMINYLTGKQMLAIDKMQVGFNNHGMIDLDPIIKFKDNQVNIHSINTRVDTWVLPFLDVYGIAGKSYSNTNIHVVEPINLDPIVDVESKYYGVGAMLAGGIGKFFISVDANQVWTFSPQLDDPSKVLTAGIRTGPTFKIKNKPEMNIALWTGLQFSRFGTETAGQIDASDIFPNGSEQIKQTQQQLAIWYDNLSPIKQKLYETPYNNVQDGLSSLEGNSTIQYSMDKYIEYPYNLLLGAQWQINRRWQIRTEAQICGDRSAGLFSVNYRFGVKKRKFRNA